MERAASPVYIGHVIGGSFGLVFIIFNGEWLPTVVHTALIILGVLAFGVIVAAFRISERRNDGRQRSVGFGGRYWLIVGAEAAVLFGGLMILRSFEPAAILGWIALVVGLHFIPLAVLWREGKAELVAIGVAMMMLGIVGLAIAFIAHDRELVAVISGVGSGIVLLASPLFPALRVVTRARRRE